MANYTASVATNLAPEEVFAYLADFSNSEQWDPGVLSARRIDAGEIGEGSEFALVAEFLGRDAKLTYRIVEFDAPNVVAFRGENATVVSLDRITFEAFGGGTRVSYDAELTLKGPLRIGDRLLALAFRRVGDRALAGMREALRTEHRSPALQ